MSAVPVPAESLAERARAAHAQFAASGTSISEWARERGFSERVVHEVLTGNRRCIRGESHKVAVALGIKAEVPPPGARHSGAASLQAAR